MSRLALFTLVLVTGCHSQPSLEAPSDDIVDSRDLAMRYGFAVKVFNRGDYEEAADLFAQTLLDVPADASGDALRHLLIQHVGWARLGAYDMRGDPVQLDHGELLLERYLVKHEALLPKAASERAEIYALLGEYQIRREGQPPPKAHDRLLALVQTTQTSLNNQLAPRSEADDDDDDGDDDDDSVRVIEVERVPWAKPDHPRVQAFFRDPEELGPSLFDNPGGPMNPTRVLVRGSVRPVIGKARSGARAYALLRAARPELERCYEQALGRGAELHERLELDLAWDANALAKVSVEDEHGFDSTAASCVQAALRSADPSAKGGAGSAHAALDLSFFVQFQGRAPEAQELDYDHFGPQAPLRLEITKTPY